MNEYILALLSGRNYTNSVGVLGLSVLAVNRSDTGNPIGGEPALVEQLKSSGKILSSSFSIPSQGRFCQAVIDKLETSALLVSTVRPFHIPSCLMQVYTQVGSYPVNVTTVGRF